MIPSLLISKNLDQNSGVCQNRRERKFCCFVSLCPRTEPFSKRSGLTRHLMKMHPDVSLDVLKANGYTRCSCSDIISVEGIGMHISKKGCAFSLSESVNNSESPPLPSEDSPIQLYHQPINPSQRYGLGFGYQQGPLVTEPVQDISHPSVCPSDLDSSPVVSFDANDDGDESNPIILPDDSGHILESNASSDMDVNVNPLEIYTDGSFLKKSNKSGFGGFYTFKDKRFEIYGPSRYNTHNAAEFEAVLMTIKSLVLLSHCPQHIIIFSDSSLVVDSLNLKASLKNPTVKRIRSQIKDLINSSRFRLFSFSFKKVLAHSDNTNNNVADVLAKRGANGSECSLLKYLRTRYHVLEGPTPLCSFSPDHSEHIADSAPLDSFNLEKSHNCPICPSFFSKARTLCCYIDTHHSSIDTDTLHINNLVRCPVCLKVFSSVGFDNHFKRHESPTLDMPCISDSLFIQLSNEIASFTYKRLSDRPSFRSAVKLVTHSSLPMEQKCRYLLVLPVVCLKLDKGSSLFKLFRFQHRVHKFDIGQCEDTSSFFCNTTPIRPHTFSNRVNIKRVKELIHDNELSRAMNLLSREPPTANITNNSMLEQLQHLHPADPNFCQYNNMLTEHYSYHDSSSVADAILNSPMTEVDCSPSQRKSNGVRPLAVGELFYRIAAGLALSKVNVDYLINSNQYGVKVPGGGEAIVHSIRSNLGLSFEKLIKFDVRNAFNEVDRCQLAQAVAEYCPLLFPFFKASYLSPSTLHFRNSVIFSERGVRQGDPLGPLLFSTALVPFATQLSTLHPSCHFYLYLDDLFVLCNDHETDAIVGTVSSFIQDIGLEVNLDKTAVVSSNDNFEVLGAHFGPNAEDDLSSSLPPITSSLLKCLESLTLQEQLLLVRHCINTKLSFHARVHRPAVSRNPLISCFHQIVSFVSSALGVVPMFPQLISLPSARFGGLGLTNYGEIAHLCFAASYITSNRTLNLFHSSLPLDDLDLMCAESLFHELGTATNSPNLSKLQALLTQNHFLETLNSLTRDFRSKPAVLASFRSPVTDPAIAPIPIKYENDVLINCKPLSQSLLFINPSEEPVDDSLLKYFLRTRLLCSEFVHHCPFCKHESNSQYHSANCEQLSSMRIRRHDDVVELISQLTGLLKEQNVGNGRVDLIRPNGSECYDLTLVGGYSTPLNTLIERRRMSKIGKYSHHVPLVPLIAFPSGGIERSFVNFLRKKEIGSYGKKISLSFTRSCFKMSKVYARLAICDLSDD
ncbi:hypothetical protein P9112_011101 [Eukaryota sp. TZLM1-RC]